MKRTLSFLLNLILILSTVSVGAVSPVDAMLQDCAEYLQSTVKKPQVGSVGGEWTVLGLARSNAGVPDEYYSDYYNGAEEYIKSKDGILHSRKYTEYSRVVLAMTAIGKNPADVGGYNLLMPLSDFEKTVWQGVNGSAWALIALDSGGYEIPENPDATVQATRDLYIKDILDKQLSDGGWSLSGEASDPDITGMVLQALSGYTDRAEVKTAVDKALDAMSERQNSKGGFESEGEENSESCIQMLVALCELGISVDDSRFVKDGNNLLDAIEGYYLGDGKFSHTPGGEANLMATEQCFYAIVALDRMQSGKSGLYNITDAKKYVETEGLSGKHPDVKKKEMLYSGKTFEDIAYHENRTAIEELASRGIINGKSDSLFEPDATMTRAEFATIVARGLGIPVKSEAVFEDVKSGDWFFDYVGTAFSYRIINGVSEKEFNPNGTITREEAAVMTARAAKLCGMDTDINEGFARDVLAGFTDYREASDWAVASLAFCCSKGIISDDEMELLPKQAVTRGEIAKMLYNMLSSAKLM